MKKNVKDFSKSIDQLMQNMTEAMEKLKAQETNPDLTEEQKKELLEQQFKQLQQYKGLTEQLTMALKKSTRHKEKNSKYHLSECIRKYKNFVFHRLRLQDSERIEDITECMYEVLREVFEMDNENKKTRLLQLYGISLKNTLASFRDNVEEVINNSKEEDAIINVEEFYGAFFHMIIDSVTQRYNTELEEAKKAQEETMAKEQELLIKEANPDVPKATSSVIGADHV